MVRIVRLVCVAIYWCSSTLSSAYPLMDVQLAQKRCPPKICIWRVIFISIPRHWSPKPRLKCNTQIRKEFSPSHANVQKRRPTRSLGPSAQLQACP